ncbi:MAG: hypothetical protein J6X78_07420 [Treponema sp.]|nr:hypothetical protein [Treponema sp.]
MQEEINVINHLLSVEKNASVLIDNAIREADSRTAQARNQANSQFKTEYDKCVSQMEVDYENTIQSRKAEHEAELEQFKSDLENRTRDYEAFNSLLDNLLKQSV